MSVPSFSVTLYDASPHIFTCDFAMQVLNEFKGLTNRENALSYVEHHYAEDRSAHLAGLGAFIASAVSCLRS